MAVLAILAIATLILMPMGCKEASNSIAIALFAMVLMPKAFLFS